MEESQVSFRQTVQTHALPSQNSCHELLLLSMNFETTPTLQLGIQQLIQTILWAFFREDVSRGADEAGSSCNLQDHETGLPLEHDGSKIDDMHLGQVSCQWLSCNTEEFETPCSHSVL